MSSSETNKRTGGGRKLGRAALRADKKNSSSCEEYVSTLTSAPSRATIETLAAECTVLGRVTKTVGCGSLQVLLQTGDTITAPISGTLRFKGRAATKADRSCCMLMGDVIIVDGGFAAGKLSPVQVVRVRKAFATAQYPAPGGFFNRQGEEAGDEEEEAGFEFEVAGAAAAADVDIDAI